MIQKLPQDIKLYILSFVTTRTNFTRIEKELEEVCDSLEDRCYHYCFRTMRTIRELEELIPIVKILIQN